MTLPNEPPLQKLQFYVTTGYSCGYLPNRLAQSLIASPQHLIDATVYSGLIQQGFRRSGKFSYRPHCENCRECVAVRIILQDFTPSRSQKRAFKKHQNLSTRILPVAFYEEHYALYASYQKARHTTELLNQDDESLQDEKPEQDETEQYLNFLCQTNVESVMVEFRENSQLKMVSVIDIVRDGISAVYTFYQVHDSKSSSTKVSFGTYNILWQVEWAKSLNLPYLYLGYWIKDSKKMAYKQNFKPLEKLLDGEWTQKI
ncbi:arginyltransferase [Methylotenera sp.]|uniref:arginyltransferase n=1 Tax=Methylotenera sp. TaxID=2051956 RepID=UPI002730377E|nr:arginyltransferase [Methylotenera sp.]MDP2072046.1 arginyltransferase [Methylotenera sp.]MDP2230631.1 arginyltransferase [Methylotenera sp.]MDP3006945.1 arginyltransferase [Methylotenera sp.]MDP3007118.1 arginyltransferase [Methylotenera sp.]MDP3140675.1 arginyltransferase [Methylotenera sp.]